MGYSFTVRADPPVPAGKRVDEEGKDVRLRSRRGLHSSKIVTAYILTTLFKIVAVVYAAILHPCIVETCPVLHNTFLSKNYVSAIWYSAVIEMMEELYLIFVSVTMLLAYQDF